MKKLPIGIQSFKKIREDNFYYVDKTIFIQKLHDSGGGYYFLSRPRRFGKSLFLDTLRWAFLGKKEYFQGLYLEYNWDWSRSFPVIYLSFGSGNIIDENDLQKRALSLLRYNQNELGVDECAAHDPREFLIELIYKAYKKYDQKIVILLDEYDKPILDNIENKQLAKAMRDKLKNLYSVIKDNDQYLEFVFITGVSKFSKVSLFSGLNNLNDITLDKNYASICGYTQKEFESVFEDKLKDLDLEKIKKWYNGYSWLGENVYNPFDVLLYLDKTEFRSFWFETGTPSFLVKLLIDSKYYIPDLEEIEVGEELIGSFDVDEIYPENLLFQTGYLTIKKKVDTQPLQRYILNFPNLEVKYSLTNYLLNSFVADYRTKDRNRIAIYKALERDSIDELKPTIHSFFASIPNDWYRKNLLSEYEGFYASVFYCYFASCGLNVIAEDRTNQGMIDMTLLYKDRAYIFEFKVVESLAEGKALQQIIDRKYYEKYSDQCSQIYLIGVEFSKEKRNITAFDVQKMS